MKTPDSLASRLVLFALILVSGTALIIGTLSYMRARAALELETQSKLDLIAQDVADDVALELSDALADIINWSRLELMRAILYRDLDKGISEFFRQVIEEHRTYRAILCVASDGSILARVGDFDAPHDVARLPALRLTLAALPEDRPAFVLTAPVPHPERKAETIGAIVLVLDPARVLAKVGTVAPGRRDHLTVALHSAEGPAVASLSSSPAGEHRAESPAAPRIVGRATLPEMEGFDLPRLAIEVSEPRAAALTAITELRAELLQMGILSMIAASLLAGWVAWRIARPIHGLTQALIQASGSNVLADDAVIPDSSGEVGLLLESFREMAVRVSSAQEQAIRQSRLALLGEIAANIAHEVRTPLAVMKTSAQLLVRADTPSAEKQRLAELVEGEVDRLNSVVGDLVGIGRPARVTYEVAPLAPILMHAIALCEASAKANDIVIESEIASVDVHVLCSSPQLYQVFLNLLRNAMQAIVHGGTITVRVSRRGPRAVVDIDDSGPGFAVEVLAKAFTPFVTTKVDGVGLGLAIARRIAAEHRGTLVATNLSPRGARLQLELPIAEGHA